MPKTLIPYVGGKSFLSSWIVKHLDYSKEIYIEPFFGGGSVLWNKRMHKVEIVNDIWAELTNFYLVLRDNFEDFHAMVQFYQYDENMFRVLKEEIRQEEDKVKRAVYFFFLMNCGFSGRTNFSSFSYGLKYNKALALLRRIKDLGFFHNRLRNVQIVNKDFRELLQTVLKNRWTNKVCIYADPPYYTKEHLYKGDFNRKDHEDLAELLNQIAHLKGFVAVSYYPFEELTTWYPKTKFIHLTKEVSKGSYYQQEIENRPLATELLIISKK